MGKTTLGEDAYGKIKGLIQDGYYQPGMPLPEKELSERLNMSRTPIREALKRLQEDMIVVIRPHLGAFVATLDLTQLCSLYEVREALEGMLARLNCKAGNPTRPFSDMLEEYRKISRLPDLETREGKYNILNSEYDQLLLKYCANPMLAKLVRSQQEKVLAFHFVSHIIPIFPDIGAKERMGVLEAIIDKDPDAAEERSRYRIRCSLQRIIDYVIHDYAKEGQA